MPVALLTAELLASLPGVRHGFTTRAGGVSTGRFASLDIQPAGGDGPAAARENIARALAAIGLPQDRLALPRQVHGVEVLSVTAAPDLADRPAADAVVTRTPGLAVGVIMADCAGILLADSEARVVGAAHAGWRGALAGTVPATLVAMERAGARRDRIAAAIGPTISQENYEVGRELIAEFTAADPAFSRFFRPTSRPGHAHFDLPGFLAAQLRAAGISCHTDLALCTYADEARFFSHRRATHAGEGGTGRQLAMIALE